MTTRRPLLLAALVPLALLACSSADDTSPSTDNAPTTTGVPQPVPPLPDDIIPVEFYIGDLAAMGNMKLIVDAVEPDRDTVTLDLGIENGALEPVLLSRSSLLLYGSDGRSTPPLPDTAAALFDRELDSRELRRDSVTFPWAFEADPVALLLDGRGYGPRVQSVMIILTERPEFDPGDP